MKKLYLISLIMMVLILSLPVVSAQQLNVIRAGGEEAATGYTQARDNLQVEVKATIPFDQNINNNQLQLWVEDSFAFFDSCVEEGESNTFTCNFEQKGFSTFKPLELIFKLLDDDNQVVAQKSQTIKPDGVRPKIIDFSITPEITKGKVKISYTLEDYGMEIGTPTGCSGLRDIQLMQNGAPIAQEQGQVGQCKRSNTFDQELTTSGKICLVVSDHVGQEGTSKCIDVRVDKTAPTITTKGITGANGQEIKRVKDTIQATIAAVITDDGELDTNSISANFASISTQKSTVKPTRSNGNTYYFENIPVSASTTCIYTIAAQDTLGNKKEEQFSCELKTDKTGPKVKKVSAVSAQKNKLPLYGYNTLINVEIEEPDDTGSAGIGLYNREVFADMSSLGMKTIERANSCVVKRTSSGNQDGKNWVCAFQLSPPTSTPEGEYTITIARATADDYDNTLQNETKYKFYYDNSPPPTPEIKEVNMILGDADQEGPLAGNFVEYIVIGQDFKTAQADFSGLGGREKQNANSCVDIEDGKRECEFQQQIKFNGPYLANISFVFADEAGNTASTSKTLEIYGLENETKGQYWKHSVTCTPDLVDRSVTTIVAPYVSCRVHLEPVQDGIKTLTIKGPESPLDCKTSKKLSINDLYLSNTAEGTQDPYIIFRLEQRDYLENKLDISCPLSILTQRVKKSGDTIGTYIARQPQILDVNFTIEFYNTPKSGLYSEVERKLERSFEDSWSNQKWLGTLQEFIFYGEMICQIKVLLTGIISLLYTIGGILGITALGMKASVVGSGAGVTVERAYSAICNVEEQAAGAYENVMSFLDSICSFLNCQGATGGKDGWSIDNVAGGGVPWCEGIIELLNEVPIVGEASKAAGIPPINIKDSLLWSTICLCLPGIVYNLEKLRQIHCYKTVCYYDQVINEGYPISHCDSMSDYLICQYVVGQIFAALPFSQLLDQLGEAVLTIITDPVALFAIAIGFVCEEYCQVAESAPIMVGCALYKVTATVGEAVGAITQMTDTQDYFKPPTDAYCGRAEDIQKEYERLKSDVPPAEGDAAKEEKPAEPGAGF